jgi:hypothetical protein
MLRYLPSGMPPLGAEVGADPGHCIQEFIHVIGGVVQIGAGPGGSREAQAAVQRLSAVVTDADGDAARIQELADVVRVNPGDIKRREADAVLACSRPRTRIPSMASRPATMRWPSSDSQRWTRSRPVSVR